METKIPTLSVVIPCYNDQKDLLEALNIIANNSYRPHEIIIVDDGSDNGQRFWIPKSLYFIVRIIINEKNMGVVASLNRGLKAATGDYVYFGSANDTVADCFLYCAMYTVEKFPQAGLCCMPAVYQVEGSKRKSVIRPLPYKGIVYLPPEDCVEELGEVPSCAVVFNREAILRYGGFCEEHKWHADWFAVYWVAFTFGVCYTPVLGATFVIHQKGYSSQKDNQLYYKLLFDVIMSSVYDKFMKNSNALAVLGWPMLKQFLRYPKLITWKYLRKAVWQSVKCLAAKLLN